MFALAAALTLWVQGPYWTYKNEQLIKCVDTRAENFHKKNNAEIADLKKKLKNEGVDPEALLKNFYDRKLSQSEMETAVKLVPRYADSDNFVETGKSLRLVEIPDCGGSVLHFEGGTTSSYAVDGLSRWGDDVSEKNLRDLGLLLILLVGLIWGLEKWFFWLLRDD